MVVITVGCSTSYYHYEGSDGLAQGIGRPIFSVWTAFTVVYTSSSCSPETNDHFGSSQDLFELSAALHARGMYLMVDVVGWLCAPVILPSVDLHKSSGSRRLSITSALNLEKPSYPQASMVHSTPLRTIIRSACHSIGMIRCKSKTVRIGLPAIYPQSQSQLS